MKPLKSNLIDAYRILSTPYRKFVFNRMVTKGKVPVFILFYHRVADNHPNDWSITNADFEKQIDWFQENFEIVDLQECQRRIQSGSNIRPTLSITFDDGYAENCEQALPMLIERRIPVTYFVTTHHTLNQQPFNHDIAFGKPLPINTIESLRSLDMAGVEIAAHSRTHPSIGELTDVDEIVDEILTSSREMEALIGRKIRYFAFPYGKRKNLHADVFHLLKREGFLGVCSAYGGYNEIGGDAFHLQRIHGDPSFARIQNWLSFDPRVLRIPRFDYSEQTIDWDKTIPDKTTPTSPNHSQSSREESQQTNHASATLPPYQDTPLNPPSNVSTNENA